MLEVVFILTVRLHLHTNEEIPEKVFHTRSNYIRMGWDASSPTNPPVIIDNGATRYFALLNSGHRQEIIIFYTVVIFFYIFLSSEQLFYLPVIPFTLPFFIMLNAVKQVHLYLNAKSLVYNNTDAYYNCSLSNDSCTLKILFPFGNAALVTSPGPDQVRKFYLDSSLNLYFQFFHLIFLKDN